MKKTTNKTPAPINYQVQQAIEQMLTSLPKGTDLGLCDVLSAMLSGYFVESGGAVMPAVEQYLRQYVDEEKEQAARSRRAAKAITYGKYNLNELLAKLKEQIESEAKWEATTVAGYRLKGVDMTAYKRARVKELESKWYDPTAGRAVPAVPFGMVGTTGQVGEQRVSILEQLICGEVKSNKPAKTMARLYKKVSEGLTEQEIAIFDAGFSLVDAVIHGIEQGVVRLAKNCTFGRTVGKVPPRTATKGPAPSRHQAEIVRPLARQHGEKLLSKSEPDEVVCWLNDQGQEIRAEIWQPLYFLERHLDRLGKEKAAERQKKKLRKIPLQVAAIYDPNYTEPLILGTPMTQLKAQSLAAIYPQRWPIEGIPQTGKYLLSGGGGRHYVRHQQAMTRLPALTMIFGSLFKYLAATFPPLRTGFWDRAAKPTYGRLLRYLKKVGIPLSSQLSKKGSVTAHLPVGYAAVAPSRA